MPSLARTVLRPEYRQSASLGNKICGYRLTGRFACTMCACLVELDEGERRQPIADR